MNDCEILELSDLCNRLTDGTLTDCQRELLNRRLKDSEEARQFYVRFAGLNASLCDYAGELQSEIRQPAPAKPKLIRHPMAWWAGIGALAATLTAAFFLTKHEAATEPGSVAWLTGATDAQWASTSGGLETGDALARGQKLDLRSGTAEVTFDSGARVVLEGPASLDVESAWSAALRNGNATASVPAEAAGFRVANPAVAVTNLGGDVRIEADRAGAEVVTLSGTAEAAPSGKAEKLLLKSRQAHRFAGGNVLPVANLDQKLSRLTARTNLDRKGRPVKFARWAADQNERVGMNARTVAFWVRIPSDAVSGDEAEIASFGHKKAGAVRLAWNTQPEQGPLGALSTAADGKTLIGRTSLRDGQWHHVALMMMGGRKQGRVEVKQYVDGHLDGGMQVALHRTDSGGEGNEFVWRPRTNKARGEFRSVVFADRPLTPYELRSLIDTNALPGGV